MAARRQRNRMDSITGRTRNAFEQLEGRQMLSTSVADVTVSPNLTINAAALNTSIAGYTPAQIKKAYGFTAVSGDGSGQTIAIVDAYNDPNIAADLAVFDKAFGLSAADLSVVSQTGSKTALPKTDAGWAGEISLDVEWAHAIAPGAKILLVEAKSDSLSDLLSAVDYARSAAGVSTVSMSWGTSEFSGETTFDSHFTTPAGHQGITFVSASGDEGSYYGPEWPSSSSNVLSVGGTTLKLDSAGNVASETPWSDSTGGTSRYEKAASYQSTASSSAGRSSPDVSFDADPNTGFAVYDSVAYQGSSGWMSVGGTSAGAPQWAALVAIADQLRASAGLTTLDGASGTLPALYSLYATAGSASYANYTSSFNDILTTVTTVTRTGGGFGHGGFFGHGFGGGFTTTTTTVAGYDTATGLGTPKVAAVVQALVAVGKTAAATTNATAKTMAKVLQKTRAFVVMGDNSGAATMISPVAPLASIRGVDAIATSIAAVPTEVATPASTFSTFIALEEVESRGQSGPAAETQTSLQSNRSETAIPFSTVVLAEARAGEIPPSLAAVRQTLATAANSLGHAAGQLAVELATSSTSFALPAAALGIITSAAYLAERKSRRLSQVAMMGVFNLMQRIKD